MARKMYFFVLFSICQTFLILASNSGVPDYSCSEDEEVITPYVYEQKVSNQDKLGICYLHPSLQTYRALYEETF